MGDDPFNAEPALPAGADGPDESTVGLQGEIERLVRQLRIYRREREVYVNLVKLGLKWAPNGEKEKLNEFCGELRKQKLPAPRISEVAVILRNRPVADEFVAGRLSVRRSLAQARQRTTGSSLSVMPSLKELERRIGLAIAELLDEIEAEERGRTDAPWTCECKLFCLTYTPAPTVTPVTPS